MRQNDAGQFVVEVIDGDGNQRIDAQGNPMTIPQLVDEMRASETFSRAFEASACSRDGGKLVRPHLLPSESDWFENDFTFRLQVNERKSRTNRIGRNYGGRLNPARCPRSDARCWADRVILFFVFNSSEGISPWQTQLAHSSEDQRAVCSRRERAVAPRSSISTTQPSRHGRLNYRCANPIGCRCN